MRPTRSSFLPLALAFLALSLGFYWHSPVSVKAQQSQRLTSFPALLMTGSVQQLATTTQACTVLQVYAPGSGGEIGANAHAVVVGDSTITDSSAFRGISLVPGAARSIPAIGTSPLSSVSLANVYALGTSGDHLMYDCWN